MTLEAPARIYQGEPVPLIFTITNIGTDSVTLHLGGRNPTADFRVSDPQGRMVWTRLRGQTLLGVLRLFPLHPGKRLTFRETWDQRTDTGALIPPGEYLIHGVLLTDDPEGLMSPSTLVQVLARLPH